MPISDVEIVLPDGSALPTGLAREIAAAGEVLKSPTGRTWVKLSQLPESRYAEDGGTPEGVLPVFVSVLKAEGPGDDGFPAEVAALTRAVAAACRRPPENVHLLYLPAATGRMSFGGRLVT